MDKKELLSMVKEIDNGKYTLKIIREGSENGIEVKLNSEDERNIIEELVNQELEFLLSLVIYHLVNYIEPIIKEK